VKLLRIAEVLAGKAVLLSGATGFVGKVILHQLLVHGPPDLRVRCLIRSGRGAGAAEARLRKEVLGAPVFAPLRRRLGGARFAAELASRVEAVEGELGPGALAPAGAVDLIIHCAGVVDFQGPLDVELEANAEGPLRVLELARAKGAALCHVSTCFVFGERSGTAPEELAVDESPGGGRGFSAADELARLRATVQRVREEAGSVAVQAELLEAPGSDAGPAGERQLRRKRERWIRRKLVDEGRALARAWGWPNVYALTKAMGERLLWAARGQVPLSIVRPSIVEAAVESPFPGWLEGTNTVAPMAYLAWRGHRLLPMRPEVVLDVIPVDHVANATIAVAAMTRAGAASGVYQLCSGDENPLRAGDSVAFTRAAVRAERARRGERRPGGWLGPRPVPEAIYRWCSAPAWARACGRAAGALERLGGRFSGAAASLRRRESQARLADSVVQIYLPFIHRTSTVFQADRTRALYADLDPGDRAAFPFAPEAIDWPRYWAEAEMEGLFRFAFPKLGEELRPLRRDLCGDRVGELWRAAADAHAGKIALVLERGGGRAERIAYADLEARVTGDAPDWPLRALAALDRGEEGGEGGVARLVALSERLAITSRDVSLCWRPAPDPLQLWACLLLPLCHGAQAIVPDPPPGALAEALLRPGGTLVPAGVADLRTLGGSARRPTAAGARAPLLVTVDGHAFPELQGAAASRGVRWVDATSAMLVGATPGRGHE